MAQTAESSEILSALGGDPTWLAHKLDLARQAILFIEMTKAHYAAASFLDDRILTPQTRGKWIAFGRVRQALADATPPAPLHFIFHSGHVGSTLLSRLLEASGNVLALREPLPLRTLAEARDALGAPAPLLSAEEFGAHLHAQLALWRRGYPDTQAVILKATSSAARIGDLLMAAHAPARAIYLNLRAEPYLAALLAGENTPVDLRGMEAERRRRLEHLLDAPAPPAPGLGEATAMAWLAERLTQARLVAAMDARVLCVDFDDFLSRPREAVIECAAHLGLAFDPGGFADLETSPLLQRYSKAPEHAYSPRLRGRIIAQSRQENAAQIRSGLAWLEALAARHPNVAAALDMR